MRNIPFIIDQGQRLGELELAFQLTATAAHAYAAHGAWAAVVYRHARFAWTQKAPGKTASPTDPKGN
jgi:hypothetical protein